MSKSRSNYIQNTKTYPVLCLDTIRSIFMKIVKEGEITNCTYCKKNTLFYKRVFPDSLLNYEVHTVQKKGSNDRVKYSLFDMFFSTDADRDRHYDGGFWGAEGGPSIVPLDVYLNISRYFMDNGNDAFDKIASNISIILDELFEDNKQQYAEKWVSKLKEEINSENLNKEFEPSGRLYDPEVNLHNYILFNFSTLSDLINQLTIFIISSLFPEDSHDKSITINIASVFSRKIPSLINNSCINIMGWEVPDPKLYRNDEYFDAIQYLCDNSLGKHTLLICGPGGDGKTTMASWLYSYFMQDSTKYYDNVLWINYDGCSMKDSFLNSLESSFTMSNFIQFNKKENDEVKYTRILECLKNVNKRILLIIDNLNEIVNNRETNDGIDKLLENNPYPLVDIMITSRNPNTSKSSWIEKCAKKITLTRLSDDLANKLFYAYYMFDVSSSDTDVVRTIVKFSHNNILIVELLAKAAKYSGLSLSDFANKLVTIGFQIPNINIRTNHGYDLVAEQICKLYCLDELSEQEKGIIISFAILNHNHYFNNKELDLYFFKDASKYAESLYNRGWLTFDPQHGYNMHDIIRLSINQNKFKNNPADLDKYHSYSKQFCSNGYFADSKYIFDEIDNRIEERFKRGDVTSCFDYSLYNSRLVYNIESSIIDNISLDNHRFIIIFVDLVLRAKYSLSTRSKLVKFSKIILNPDNVIFDYKHVNPKFQLSVIYLCYSRLFEVAADYSVSRMHYEFAIDEYLSSIKYLVEYIEYYTRYIAANRIVKNEKLNSNEIELIKSLISGLFVCHSIRLIKGNNDKYSFANPIYYFNHFSELLINNDLSNDQSFMDVIHILLKALYCCLFVLPSASVRIHYQILTLGQCITDLRLNYAHHKIFPEHLEKLLFIFDAYDNYFSYICGIIYNKNPELKDENHEYLIEALEKCKRTFDYMKTSHLDIYNELTLFVYKTLIDCYIINGDTHSAHTIILDLLKNSAYEHVDISIASNNELSLFHSLILKFFLFRLNASQDRFFELYKEMKNFSAKTKSDIINDFCSNDLLVLSKNVNQLDKFPWIGTVFHLAPKDIQDFFMNPFDNVKENVDYLITESILSKSFDFFFEQIKIIDNPSGRASSEKLIIRTDELLNNLRNKTKDNEELLYLIYQKDRKIIYEKVRLVTFITLESTNKIYIVYTKNEKDLTSDEIIYISILDIKSSPGYQVINEISSNEEWKLVLNKLHEMTEPDSPRP